MYEVELKVAADHRAAREALRDRGATPRGTVTQEDTYYDAPHRDFGTTDEALRLRTETTGENARAVTLTYKGPLLEEASKTREERETTVGDADAAGAILEAVGFDPVAVVHKERERFALEGYTVSLDDVEGLGQFLEIETRAGEIEDAREGARAHLRELGFDPAEHVRESYLGLLLES